MVFDINVNRNYNHWPQPFPQIFAIGRFSFLVFLGWFAIISLVGLTIFKNEKYANTPVYEKHNSRYFTNFSSPPDPQIWRSIPIVQLGETCLYPDRWKWSPNLLSLPLDRLPSFCSGHTAHFRGAALATTYMLTPPFSVTARMKAAPTPTVVSAFFTYTDPLDGSPHFENDFEFPGDGVGRFGVWTNAYAPGGNPSTGDPKYIPLGFDPSARFAEYRLEVRPRQTIWYVEGQVVRVRNQINQEARPQKIVLNAWQASVWGDLYPYTFYRPGGDPFTIESIAASEDSALVEN